MSEFQIEQWCDYVRGVAGSEETAGMRLELDAGDEEAGRLVATLSRVSELSRADRDFSPPAFIVDAAKAVLGVQQELGQSASQRSQAVLAPHSDQDPVPLDIRSPSAEELLYRTENLTVRLQLSQRAKTPGTHIRGRIMERSGKRLPVGNVSFLASTEAGIVDHGVSAETGEFELHLPDSRLPSSITAVLSSRRTLTLDLPHQRTAPPTDEGRE